MKRIITLVLSLAMLACSLFVFAACGKDENVLVCGVTLYEPMNYLNDKDEWVGFDTEFAQLVGEKLGMEVKFQKIEWQQKYTELNTGNIDCIWNGFTANAEDDGKPRIESVDFSYSYMYNQQCIVVKKDNLENYKDVDSLKGKKAAAESGSAGESAAKKLVGEGIDVIKSSAQINTFTEVKSGAVDFAVVDIFLARSLAGKGDYSDLAIAEDIVLEAEVYAIGFKKGSDLKDKVNKAIQELYDEGKLTEIAKKYDLEDALKIEEFKG